MIKKPKYICNLLVFNDLTESQIYQTVNVMIYYYSFDKIIHSLTIHINFHVRCHMSIINIPICPINFPQEMRSIEKTFI